jgi:hypothetical protein
LAFLWQDEAWAVLDLVGLIALAREALDPTTRIPITVCWVSVGLDTAYALVSWTTGMVLYPVFAAVGALTWVYIAHHRSVRGGRVPVVDDLVYIAKHLTDVVRSWRRGRHLRLREVNGTLDGSER